MLSLDRPTLAKLLQGNRQAIAIFERVINDVGGALPSTIEEANALASQALALAQMNTALLSLLADTLAHVETAPVPIPAVDHDDTTPRVHLGTISSQNADQVEITGGIIGVDGGSAAAPSLYFGGDRTTGIYRGGPDMLALAVAGSQRAYFDAAGLGVWGNVSASGQLVSTIAAGTPPLVVTSTTRVVNLNVDRAGIADVANGLTSPTTYPANATDLASCIALANALKAANISKGV